MSAIDIDEATGGEAQPEIVEMSGRAEVKSLLSKPHVTDSGTLEIKGAKRAYKFTRPMPQKGSDGVDAVIQFAGVVEIEGKSIPYSMVRLTREDGLTETLISVNGSKARVVREPPPQTAVYEGKVEVHVPQPFSYKVEQTIARGEAALERDELEAIMTATNNLP